MLGLPWEWPWSLPEEMCVDLFPCGRGSFVEHQGLQVPQLVPPPHLDIDAWLLNLTDLRNHKIVPRNVHPSCMHTAQKRQAGGGQWRSHKVAAEPTPTSSSIVLLAFPANCCHCLSELFLMPSIRHDQGPISCQFCLRLSCPGTSSAATTTVMAQIPSSTLPPDTICRLNNLLSLKIWHPLWCQ